MRMKPIPGHPMYYIVDDGRIWTDKHWKWRTAKDVRGYEQVQLKHNRVSTYLYIHRLVAEAFVENPDPEHNTIVWHKDGDLSNNNCDNLEWISLEEMRRRRRKVTLTRAVVQTLPDGTERIYTSLTEAARENGITKSLIANCCRGRKPTVHGSKWRYYGTWHYVDGKPYRGRTAQKTKEGDGNKAGGGSGSE